MREDERLPIYNAWMMRHAASAVPTEEPCVYFSRVEGGVPLPLLRADRDDLEELVREGVIDPSARCAQNLLRQLNTYASRRQRILALIFSPREIHSDVLTLPP